MHSTAAPYIGTGGSILLRDIWWRYVRKQECGDAEQIWVNRLFATVITIAALAVGLTSTAVLVMLGGLATAFGFVMDILLMGTLWVYDFRRTGLKGTAGHPSPPAFPLTSGRQLPILPDV